MAASISWNTPPMFLVLIAVGAAGVINNTDINTHLSWCSKRVQGGTGTGGEQGFGQVDGAGSHVSKVRTWLDIVAAGADDPKDARGRTRSRTKLLRHYFGRSPYECWTLGSECDIGFAQFVIAPSDETFAITPESAMSDTELAAIPCAYSNADRASVRDGCRPGRYGQTVRGSWSHRRPNSRDPSGPYTYATFPSSVARSRTTVCFETSLITSTERDPAAGLQGLSAQRHPPAAGGLYGQAVCR